MLNEDKNNNYDTLVIIPNYNHLDLLKKCLLCLENQNVKDFFIMIVDNGSDNQTVEYINNYCSEKQNCISLLLNENTGFAHASNEGFRYAIAHGYKYSILLNNDCYVEKDFIEQMRKAITNDDKLFAVNPLMISEKNRNLVDDFGDSYNILGFAFQNKVGHKVSTIIKDEEVFSACGGASIYRNDILIKIGLLDENFFCYLEDIDLSYRARIYGYKIKTCKASRCYHVGSATSGSRYNDFKVSISSRNNIYLIYKNMPILQIIINIIPLLIGTTIKLLFFIKKGFGKAYIKGIVEGFKNIKKIDKIHIRKAFIYGKIEFYLIKNTFRYFIEFIKRHI